MSRRMFLAFAMTVALLAMAGFQIDRSNAPVEAAQPAATWNNSMLWQPSLGESGDALAALVNQIPAGCSVDVDPAATTNGASPEGVVYAFAVTWSCPASVAQDGSTWQSAMIWRPTLPETGDALAELTNQIDASCSVDVDRVVATNGAGPEGPVYAFAVTWACPSAASGA